MHITLRMEQLSKAIIHAIASQEGHEVSFRGTDIDSIDNSIHSIEGKRPQIDFQLKSTSSPNYIHDNQTISLRIPIKNYNDLRIETINPRIIIVVILPIDINNWMEYDIDKIILYSSSYWVSILGHEEKNNADKDGKVTIHIPKTNILNSNQLKILFNKIHKGEQI